jgi:flagella basal body P-ring formation protein FlgA
MSPEIGQNKTMRLPRSFSLHPLLASLVLFFAAPSVPAQEAALRGAVEDFIRAQTRGLPGEMRHTIHAINNARPCDAFEPFIPPGNRLWGRSTVGVRCLSPSVWTIYLQVNVSVTGNYLVATRRLATGSLISPNDIAIRSGEITAFPATILTDPSQAIGKTVKNGIVAGQPFRSDSLIAPWAIVQGQTVRTISKGSGFSVTSEGKALNNANEGQIVQVRTPSGQMLSGFARAGGIVEVVL